MNFEWLSGVEPLWGTVIIIGAYILILVAVMTRKSATIYEGAPDRARWRDLRLWAVPVLILQIWLYWLLR
jgi:hypothetical protein